MASGSAKRKTKRRSKKGCGGHGACCANVARKLAGIYGFDAEEALKKLGLNGSHAKTQRKTKTPRKQSAYMRFCAKERANVPKMSPTEVMKELGKRWRNLSDADKKKLG